MSWRRLGIRVITVALLAFSTMGASAPLPKVFSQFLAGLPSDVRVAYAKDNWSLVLERSRPAAEKGNPYAQTMMGLLSYFGHGVPQDYLEAARWYTLAAEQGFAIAQANLADIYNEGLGVSKDYGKAMGLWKQAAENGHTIAMANIGRHYLIGMGVPIDKCEAYDWWSKAASLGGGLGQDQLSVMFARGDGVPNDYFQAFIWSTLAEKYIEPERGGQRIYAAQRSKKIARNLTPAQLSEATQHMRDRSLAELVAALPICSPQIDRYTIQYDITGLTNNKLVSEIYKHGPQLDGKRYAGNAYTNVAYYYNQKPTGSECIVTDLSVSVTVLNIEPRLKVTAKTPPRLLAIFSKFVDRLHAFQDGHAQIAIEFAKNFRERALRIRPAPTCRELEGSMKELFNLTGATATKRHSEFSKLNWGATRFPKKGHFASIAEHLGLIFTLALKRVISLTEAI